VGVVSTVRSTSLELEPTPAIYVPYHQNAWPTMSAVIRTAGDPVRFASLVRGEVVALDRNQPVYNVRSLDQVLARAVAARRFQTLLLGAFAVAALALAVIGVYGLLAYAVAQRTREFGIRVALGAQRRDVVAFILWRALTLMGAGLVIGGTGALAGSWLLTTILFEVSPWDPTVFVGSMVILTIAGLLASYLPARRATMVNPVVALRCE
jgi:ABC-type antimicrobial peptide transport system permease subunit